MAVADEAEKAIHDVLKIYVEHGDIESYRITEAGKVEAKLTEKGEDFIDVMGEFFDSFTQEELEINELAVAAQVIRAIRPQPMNPS
jgi:hypothetical protein